MRITNKERLAAHGNREGRKIVAELLDAGLDALDPYVRVKQLVHVENGKIVLHTDGFEMKGDPHAGPLEFDLKDYDRVYVIGAAKGVQRAALAMEEALGDVLTGGHVIAKHGEDIIFLRKIERGGADKSFGIHVAHLAGMPRPVIMRAHEILARLETNDVSQSTIGQNILGEEEKKPKQVNLFEAPAMDLVEEIRALDVMSMTPIEALNTLFTLKEKARKA